MSDGFVSMAVAKPSKSDVYAVRYIAKALHDPDDVGHECQAFAYWDNQYKRWARPTMAIVIAINVRKTAAFQYHTRQDLDWKALV